MTRHQGSQFVVGLSTLLLAAALLSCGIRGRPLPPLVIVPAVVSDLSAVRLGGEVHLEFTVPEANADGSQPPDIERIDIYAVTTMPPADGSPLVLDEWLEDADPILTFDIVVPEEPRVDDGDEPDEGGADAALTEPAAHGPGELLTAVEPLTPDIIEPVEIEQARDEDEEEPDADAPETVVDSPPPPAPLLSPPLPRIPRRTYVAVAVSRRNRQSAVFAAPPVPVQPAPEPPGVPVLTYTETSIDIEWTAPETARLPVQQSTVPVAGADAAAGDEDPPAAEDAQEVAEPGPDAPQATDSATDADGVDQSAAAAPAVLASTTLLPPQTPSRYDVYDVSPPPPEEESEAGGEPDAVDGGIIRPLTDQPLAATSHAGVEATLGVERCFVVRTVDTVDPVDRLPLRSAASETACVLLADIFPPAAPTGLVAVAGAGAISLTWDANAEADLAGYLVLRGRDPEAELEALTPEPITVTNFRDAAVEAGVDYVYAVQAVDASVPQNISEASVQVAEQAP